MSGQIAMMVCTNCDPEGGFEDRARAQMDGVKVVGVDCMSGCARAQAVAFRTPDKVAYLFGDITDADIPHLQNFARLYDASDDGRFADARVLGPLREKALARIPT